VAQGFCVQLPPRILTANGVVGAGYLIYTYVTNSVTPKATYSDGQLLSLNTNPIVADANGRFRCFIAQGQSVKLVIHDASDVLVESYDYQNPMIADPAASSVTAVPAGGILAYGAAAAPSGFLLCDGSAVSRATYAALFAIIGTTFGAGDGSSTFNLPDMRGKFPIGKATAGTGSTLGGSGGAIDHTHTGPAHTHSVTVPRTGWGAVNVNPDVAGELLVGGGSGLNNYMPTGDQAVTSASGGTGNTGASNPPFVSVNFIIKT
jgi:microcystin-dependent protein